jgi:outer membrane protein assembly factor BamB
MTEHLSAPQSPTPDSAGNVPPVTGGFSRWRRVGSVLTLLWLAFVAVGQAFVWGVMDPVMGPSIQNLVTVSMAIVTALVIVLWLLCFSPFRWRLALPLALAILLPLGGLIASVRQVDFTGDMQPVLRFRWEPTQAERLQAFRPAANGTAVGDVGDVAPEPTPEDMPSFRGAQRDGVVAGPPLLQDWSATPPRELWRRPCGGGYSSFAVVAPYAVTIEQRGATEAVVAYDTDTGNEHWVHEYPADFQEPMGGPGPRSTPTIHRGRVYVLGALGDLHCLNLLDGESLWHVNILTDNGLLPGNGGSPLNSMWAMAGSPLTVDDLVVVNAGGPAGNGLVAYGLETGERVWQGEGLANPTFSGNATNRAGYSSPMLADLAGARQILIFDGVGVRGCDRVDGRQLWSFQFDGGGGGDPGVVNVAQPLVLNGDRVLISASYGRGSALLHIVREGDAWRVGEGDSAVWPVAGEVNLKLRSKFSSPVLHDGFVYGLDEGVLVCLDPETGQSRWKKGRYGHGQLLLTNGQIVLLSEQGELVLIQPSPEEFIELSRIPILPGGKTWNPLALARGRAYLRNHFEAVCLDLCATNQLPGLTVE